VSTKKLFSARHNRHSRPGIGTLWSYKVGSCSYVILCWSISVIIIIESSATSALDCDIFCHSVAAWVTYGRSEVATDRHSFCCCWPVEIQFDDTGSCMSRPYCCTHHRNRRCSSNTRSRLRVHSIDQRRVYSYNFILTGYYGRPLSVA